MTWEANVEWRPGFGFLVALSGDDEFHGYYMAPPALGPLLESIKKAVAVYDKEHGRHLT